MAWLVRDKDGWYQAYAQEPQLLENGYWWDGGGSKWELTRAMTEKMFSVISEIKLEPGEGPVKVKMVLEDG